MNTFGRNLIPFANTGAVCRICPVDKNDRLYTDLGSSKELISDILRNSINFVIFAGFGNPKDLSILRKELEDTGVKFVNYSFTALPSSVKGDGSDVYSHYALILEKFNSAMKSRNFMLCFPSVQFMNAAGLLWGSMVLADESLDADEFDQYLFTEDFTGRKSLKEDLKSLKSFLYSQERLLQKSLKGLKKLLEETQEEVFENPLNLNLSALEKPVHISPVDTTEITFNLESLEPKEFVSESEESDQAEKIVDELLNMAEQLSQEPAEEELTWESAFPDTGQKIASNLTIIKDLDTEPLTEIDLDSVPYPEVLDIENLDLEELDDPVTVPISEISFENDDDDRTIMGIVTVETEPEETVKKPPKKETPPPTIIVTAEKVETIKPISEEFKNKSKNNFRAIRLD